MFILRVLMLAAAAGAVAGGAYVHGKVTDRWGAPEELLAATDRLNGLPVTVGDWDGVPSDLDAETFKMANVTGAKGMRYTHRVTQQEVTVMVVVGRPGQVAAHPPEVCYKASGYTVGPKKVRELGRFGTAWEGEFSRAWPTPEAIRLVWAWGRGDQWSATSAPEVAFAASAHLYKIYVVQRAVDGEKDRTLTQGFLDVFLPACQAAFAPPAAGAAQ
jgi:hypothetical protein